MKREIRVKRQSFLSISKPQTASKEKRNQDNEVASRQTNKVLYELRSFIYEIEIKR